MGTALRTTESIRDKWWVTLGVPYLMIGLQLFAIVILDPTDYPSSSAYIWLARILSVGFFVALVGALVGLSFNMIYVAESSEWTPSMWDSLMFFVPVIGVVIGLHYLSKRSRYGGLF
jgi:hypothetical protein